MIDRAPVQHLGEPAGVGVEVGDVAGQLAGDVGHHGDGVGEVLGQEDERGVVGGGQRPLGDGERRRRVLREVVAAEVTGHVADQRHPRLVGGGAQRVGVAEPLGLRVERLVLARLRVRPRSISSSPCRRTSAACASSRAWLRRRSRSAASCRQRWWASR